VGEKKRMNVKSEMLFKDSMPTRSKQSKLKVFVSGGTTILGMYSPPRLSI